MASLQRTNLTDSLIAEIQRMISTGELCAGQRLPAEPELAARFGVGRSTVREAMKALALMGVVDIAPGRGTYVRQDAQELLSEAKVMRVRLRDSRVQEVYEARKVMEVELAALAAERATPEDIARMEAAIDEMRRTTQDDEAYTEADLRFHLAVAAAAKNSLLEQFYCFADTLVTQVIQEVIKMPNVKASSIALHSATCEAIKHGDVAASRASILNHMRYVRRVIEAEGYGPPLT